MVKVYEVIKDGNTGALRATGRSVVLPDDCPLFPSLGPEAVEGAAKGALAVEEGVFTEVAKIILETGDELPSVGGVADLDEAISPVEKVQQIFRSGMDGE